MKNADFCIEIDEILSFVEVSRSFVTKPYELFEWDTFFGEKTAEIKRLK